MIKSDWIQDIRYKVLIAMLDFQNGLFQLHTTDFLITKLTIS